MELRIQPFRQWLAHVVSPSDAGLDAQTLPVQQHDFLEEPTFVAPTKRQADKSGRSKPKEKKENCKQQ